MSFNNLLELQSIIQGFIRKRQEFQEKRISGLNQCHTNRFYSLLISSASVRRNDPVEYALFQQEPFLPHRLSPFFAANLLRAKA